MTAQVPFYLGTRAIALCSNRPGGLATSGRPTIRPLDELAQSAGIGCFRADAQKELVFSVR